MEKLHNMFLGQKALRNSFLSCAKWVCCFLLVFGGVVQTLSAAEASAVAQQQNKSKVTGIVTDENGEPLIGVTIAVKGQSIGTVTDINGKYVLDVPHQAVLVVSYVGFKRQFVDYKGQNALNIKLESDVEKLNEVVVIGYGTQKVKDVSGAISSVDMQKAESLPVSTMTEALSGQIPGLSVSSGSGRPGSNDATLQVRQTFDFSKDGSSRFPLIVIDDVIQTDPQSGLPTMDSFNRLDPSEVESITVLRDASAAIYGSRASQGAIIVKTKRGKEGSTKVSYSGKFEWNDAISHEKTMNAYEYGLYANSLMRTKQETDVNKYFSDSELDQMKSLNYNWLDKAWSGAGAMQHAINVNGGSTKATYFAGASYYTQGANLGSQDYNRYNFRAGTDVKLTNNLKLSATINANNSKQEKIYTKVANINDSSYGSIGKGEQADYTYLLHMPRYIPWSYNVGGTDYWVSPALGAHQKSNSQIASNQISVWNYFALSDGQSKAINDNFNYGANFALQYDIPFVKGLSVKATYALNRSSVNTEQYQLPYTLALATNTNTAGAHLYGDGTTWSVAENPKQARVLYDVTTSKAEQENLYITYDRSFGLHNVSAVASVERSENSSVFNRQFYDNPLKTYNGAGSSAGTLNTGLTQNTRSEGGTLSYLGRVSYSYASRYLAQFILRADASTNFAPENYWGLFPTLSLGWVMSEEPWFKNNVKWVDYLKLRGSIGKTGKDNIKPWKWMQLYSYASDKGLGFGSNNGGSLVAGVTPDQTPNRDAHWDTDTKYNLGLDLHLLQNRLSVSVDGYYDHNTDMLTLMGGASGVPISVGGSFAEQNYSAIDAWGTDISISWRDKVGDVKYNIGVNTSLNWNKVNKYPSAGNVMPSNTATRVGMSTIQPQWGFKVWKGNAAKDGVLRTQSDIDAYWDYLTGLATAAGTTPSYFGNTTKASLYPGMLAYQDLGGTLQPNGTVSASDGNVKADGSDYAKLVKRNTNYGFTTNLGIQWKDFSWTAQISTSWGQYTALDNIKQGFSSNQMLWAHESFWTDMFDATTNPNGKYPNAYYSSYNNYTSDFWQVSSFRCYIKNMGVAYSVPKKLTAKLGVDNVKLSLSGNNLWDFYNPFPKKYRNMYDDSNTAYPTLRTWALGVNVTF